MTNPTTPQTEPTQEAIDVYDTAFEAHYHGDLYEGRNRAAHIIQAALDKREAEADARSNARIVALTNRLFMVQQMLETIDRTQSTDFAAVRTAIISNRYLLAGKPKQ